ncbi:MAG: hypothetical protein QOF89_2051 [Acidobacteriota bacterium]|jgi:hypothetical protein|nr:hypothetical protein [Acidobacteriota bacterium]
MNDPLFRGLLAGADLRADLNDELRRLLEAATVQVRLALLEESLTALSERRSCIVELGKTTLSKTTITVDAFQVHVLSRCFLIDPSPQVRRRLARRVVDLGSKERFPFLARLLWDPDEGVRKIAARNLREAGPLLTYLREIQPSQPRPEAPPVPRRPRPDLGPVRETRGAYSIQELGPPAPDQPPAGSGRRGIPIEMRAAPEAAEEVVRRFTACDFTGNPQRPATGRVTFALRIQPVDADSRPVDLRIPEGKDAATVLVHAFSSQFTVGPEVWVVKVPRAADSDVASFAVQADQPGEGEVGLLVYDEYRLIGSLILKLRAVDTPQGLTLEKAGAVVFRDPAPTSPVPSTGVTVQVSLAGGDGRIAFHLLLPLAEGSGWPPIIFPLGRSADPLQADGIQTALGALRAAVDEIEQGLGNPAALGAASVDEALQGIRLNLEGAGRQIAEDLLSPVVREVLASRRPGSVVHWVIRDSSLDAIPWELAWSSATGHPFNQDLVLVRVPVRGDPAQTGGALSLPSTPALPPAPDRLLYVLGANVATPQQFPAVREVVQSVGGYEVVTNFDGGERQAVGILQLRDQIQSAKLIHLLCHGIVEKDRGLYLEIEENVLGRLTPVHVRGFHLPPNAVVFVTPAPPRPPPSAWPGSRPSAGASSAPAPGPTSAPWRR